MEQLQDTECPFDNHGIQPNIELLPEVPTASSASDFLATSGADTTDRFCKLPAPISNVCYVGAGYVGGTSAAIMALANPKVQVNVVDIDAGKIKCWNSKHLPISEAGLDTAVRIAREGLSEKGTNLATRAPNLTFSSHVIQHISEADLVFLTATTQTKAFGHAAGSAIDIGHLKSAVKTIAASVKAGVIIVEKSTVPCNTAEMIKDLFRDHRPGVTFEVLSNPEFLTEGTAVMDTIRPSRVLIGSETTSSGIAAAERLTALYHWVSPDRVLRVTQWSSELAKLASNAFLAQRISSINTISAIAESIGADITEVSQAIGLDHRIGGNYLRAGLGFGGSCLKKDTLGLVYLAEALHLPKVASYWRSVLDVNEWQVDRYVRKILDSFHGTMVSEKVAILGFAFKENTSDTRDSQSIQVLSQLLNERPDNITIFDPGCDPVLLQDQLLQRFRNPKCSLKAVSDPYQACNGASAVLILTPWDAFKYPSCSGKGSTHAALQSGDILTERSDGHIKLAFPGRFEIQEGYLRAAPTCISACQTCQSRSSQESWNGPVDWERVVNSMQQPKWIFDARQQVDVKQLSQLGCKVFSTGQSSYSKMQ